jgi:hypothetical protein
MQPQTSTDPPPPDFIPPEVIAKAERLAILTAGPFSPHDSWQEMWYALEEACRAMDWVQRIDARWRKRYRIAEQPDHLIINQFHRQLHRLQVAQRIANERYRSIGNQLIGATCEGNA